MARQTRTHASSRPRFNAIAPAIVLIGLTLIAYLPAFRAGFIWDDPDYVTQNATLRSFDGSWPLLQAVARDAELSTLYQAELARFADEQLVSGALFTRIDTLAALVRPSLMREDAVRPGALSRFDSGVSELRAHLTFQRDAIAEFVR